MARRVPPLEELLPMSEAARYGGYADQRALVQAIKRGSLRSRRIGRYYYTTKAWMDEYLAHRPPNPWYEERRRARRVDGEDQGS